VGLYVHPEAQVTPYTNEDFAWVRRIRAEMKGYWILGSGKLSVTFYVPSRWERFCAWFSDETWVAFK
jgi:hypothetical protein